MFKFDKFIFGESIDICHVFDIINIVITNQLRNGELQMKTINHTIVLQRTSIIVGDVQMDIDGNITERHFIDNHVEFRNNYIHADIIATLDSGVDEPIYLYKITDSEHGIETYYVVNHIPHYIYPDALDVETINYTHPLDSDNDINALIEFAETFRTQYNGM